MLVKCKFSLVSKSFNILIMKATNGDEKSSQLYGSGTQGFQGTV